LATVKGTPLGVTPYREVAMTLPDVSLWSRSAESQIALARALQLFDAAYRATGKSSRTIDWYRQRLGYFFDYLAGQQGSAPRLADFVPQAFRLFILERQARPRYAGHPYKRPTDEPPSSAYPPNAARRASPPAKSLFPPRDGCPYTLVLKIELAQRIAGPDPDRDRMCVGKQFEQRLDPRAS